MISKALQEIASNYLEAKSGPMASSKLAEFIRNSAKNILKPAVQKDSEYFNDKPRVIDVVPILLEDILQSNQCQQIDYLSLDIEGNEVEILSDYLKKYPHKVKLFSFESNYTRPSKAFLNYKMIHQAGVDYFFAKT